jgi:ATP-dependent RNA helicase DDX54/DBP10
VSEPCELAHGGRCEQVADILKATAEARQALLFSATLPAALADFAAVGLRSPALVRLDADSKLSPTLALRFFAVRESDKPAALLLCLQVSRGCALHACRPCTRDTHQRSKHRHLCALRFSDGCICRCVSCAPRDCRRLQEVLPVGTPTVVFVATKHRVEYLKELLEQVCCLQPHRPAPARMLQHCAHGMHARHACCASGVCV